MTQISEQIKLQLKPDQKLKKAAVLVPIFERDGELYTILTRRSSTVRHHKGQISFPGGAVEQQDHHLWHTALRETEEELGISSQLVHYVEELPILHTPTLFEITPFLGFVHSQFEVTPEPDEVEEVIYVPMSHLMNLENLRFEDRDYFGKSYPIPFFTYKNYEIWGATGRIILSWLDRWG